MWAIAILIYCVYSEHLVNYDYQLLKKYKYSFEIKRKYCADLYINNYLRQKIIK